MALVPTLVNLVAARTFVLFILDMKGMVYWSFVRSAMLYGSKTWCLRENEMAILRRTEKAMVRTMCGAKLMEKKRTEDL